MTKESNGDNTTIDEEATQTAEEFLQDSEPMQKVLVGPHPLGGIRFGVWDRAQSTFVEQRIDIPEATMLASHLGALITMAFQTIYAEQARLAQASSSGLIIPGQ